MRTSLGCLRCAAPCNARHAKQVLDLRSDIASPVLAPGAGIGPIGAAEGAALLLVLPDLAMFTVENPK